jgi:PAS domain S-box-containing protein
LEVNTIATEFRKSGISVVGDVPWGTHFCHFYETKQDLLDTLIPYFKAGLERREFCLWVVSDAELLTVEQAKEALAQAVPNLDRHLADENIEIVGGHDWYFEQHALNLERAKHGWDAKLKRALARGFEGLRVSADTFWLAERDWKDFFAYEKQVNDWITNQSMTVMCTYPLAKSGASEVLDVVHAHQFAIARRHGEWEVIETPDLIQAKAEIKRLNETLQHATERTPKPSVFLSYGVAVLSVSAALIIALWMESVLQSAAHVSLFLCAVMLSTWFGGVRPGLLAIALSVLAFAYILPPNYSLAVETREIPRLLIFGLSALLVGSVSAALRSKAESLTHARDILNETVQELKRTNVALQAENAERKRAEDALRRSEDRLRLVIDTVPALIHTGLPDGQLDFFNQRWLDFVGLSLEDLSGWKWTAVIHPDDVAAMVERWRAALATGEPYEHEARVRRADGEYRLMVHREVPLRDERGNIVKWYASSIDIEDRKRAEDALRRSEDRIRLIIDTIPTMAWTVRPDGIVDFVNQRWMDYTGLSLEEESEEPTRPIHPEDVPKVMERWLEERQIGEPYEDELRLRRADGEYRWFLVRTAPLRDEQGNVVKWYGVSTDIEDLKRADAALKESQRKLEEAQRIAHVGHWDRDLETRRITWSDEIYRILGLPLGERDSPRTEWLEVVHPEDRPSLSIAIEEMLRGIRRLDMEFRIVRPNGEVRFLHSQGDVIRDEREQPVRMFGTAQDITERKRAEEQLKATTEQLRALSARLQSAREQEGIRIARELHDELGAALSSLRWDFEEVVEVISGSADQSEFANLKKRIEGMIGLTDTTVNAVRRIASELRPIALDELGLSEALEWQARQFQERTGIIVECDCHQENVELTGEQSTAVFRIFQEALTNILRHADATKVYIQLHKQTGAVILKISDNGRGITDDEKSGQVTLGLLGMRERAHLIGGTININGSDGKGTVITVRIPISP